MRTDVTIEIVVLVEKASGFSEVVYLCDVAPPDDSMDIYVTENRKLIALYHHDAYSAARREVRADKAMVYPDGRGEKLILVGQVSRTVQLDPATHLEVSRAHLHLKAIPIDEW